MQALTNPLHIHSLLNPILAFGALTDEAGAPGFVTPTTTLAAVPVLVEGFAEMVGCALSFFSVDPSVAFSFPSPEQTRLAARPSSLSPLASAGLERLVS